MTYANFPKDIYKKKERKWRLTVVSRIEGAASDIAGDRVEPGCRVPRQLQVRTGDGQDERQVLADGGTGEHDRMFGLKRP